MVAARLSQHRLRKFSIPSASAAPGLAAGVTTRSHWSNEHVRTHFIAHGPQCRSAHSWLKATCLTLRDPRRDPALLRWTPRQNSSRPFRRLEDLRLPPMPNPVEIQQTNARKGTPGPLGRQTPDPWTTRIPRPPDPGPDPTRTRLLEPSMEPSHSKNPMRTFRTIPLAIT